MNAPQGKDSLRTPLAKAKGLGSAHTGFHHWWMERLTSLALVPLTVWFVFSVVGLTGKDAATLSAWLESPVQAALMTLFVLIGLYHSALGLKVVMEDYISSPCGRLGLTLTSQAVHLFAATVAVFAIWSLHFGF